MNTIEGVLQPTQSSEPIQGEGQANIDLKPPEEPANIKLIISPPRRNRKTLAVIFGIAGTILILASINFQDAKWLFDHLLPYSQPIGGAAIAIMVLIYKDLKSYRNPVAALAVLCSILLFSGMAALNTFRERQNKSHEKTLAEQSASTLTEKIELTREQVVSNARKTGLDIAKLSGDFNNFKEEVKPEELRNRMDAMNSELEKTQVALAPVPKADLTFTFPGFKNAGTATKFVPIREIILNQTPDGVVTIPVVIVNPTNSDAGQGHINFIICDACKYAKEPKAMTKIEGMPEQLRDLSFIQLLAMDSVTDVTLDVIPPVGAKTFQIGIQYRCRSCTLQKEAVVGTVNINSPYVNPKLYISPKLLTPPTIPMLPTLTPAQQKPNKRADNFPPLSTWPAGFLPASQRP